MISESFWLLEISVCKEGKRRQSDLLERTGKKQESTLDAVKQCSSGRGQGYQRVLTLRAAIQKERHQGRWSASLPWNLLLFHHRAQCWWTFFHLHFSHLLCCLSVLTNELTTPTQCGLPTSTLCLPKTTLYKGQGWGKLGNEWTWRTLPQSGD